MSRSFWIVILPWLQLGCGSDCGAGQHAAFKGVPESAVQKARDMYRGLTGAELERYTCVQICENESSYEGGFACVSGPELDGDEVAVGATGGEGGAPTHMEKTYRVECVTTADANNGCQSFGNLH